MMNDDLKTRLGGLVLLAIGVGAGWYLVLRPYRDAWAGATEISYSLKAFVIVPFCLVLGLAFTVLGRRFDYRDAERKRLKPLGWATFVLIAILSGAGYWWFKTQFELLGFA